MVDEAEAFIAGIIIALAVRKFSSSQSKVRGAGGAFCSSPAKLAGVIFGYG